MAFVFVADDPNTFTVYATFDQDGGLSAFGDTRAGPLNTRGDEGSRLVLLQLARSDFVEVGGSPLADETWTELIVADAATPPLDSRSCGRCLAFADRAPQLVLPGDRCPLPVFGSATMYRFRNGDAEPEADSALLDRARERLRLEWPGRCPCTPHEARPARPGRFCPWTAPAPDRSITGDAFVVTPQGRLIIAGSGFVAAENIETQLDPALGRILAAGVLADTEDTLISSLSPGPDDRVELTAVDRDLISRSVVIDNVIEPHAIISSTSPPSLFLLGRTTVGLNIRAPGVTRCSVNAGALTSCTDEQIEPANCQLEGEILRDAAKLQDRWIAAGDRGHVFLRDAARVTWRCLPGSENARFELGEGSSYTLARLEHIATIGARLFACGFLTRDGSAGERRSVVLTASIAAGAEQDVALSIVWAGEGATCSSLTRSPDHAEHHVVVFGRGERRLVLDRDAQVLLSETPATLEGLNEPLAALIHHGEHFFAKTPSERWFGARAGEAFVHRYGPLAADPGAAGPVVSWGREVLLVRADRPPSAARRGPGDRCESVEVRTLELPDAIFPPRSIATAAAIDSSDVLIIAGVDQQGTFLLELELALGGSGLTSLERLAGITETIGAIAAPAPGSIVFIAGGVLMQRIDRAPIEAVELIGETAPPLDFDVLTSAAGVVWAGGENVLARLVQRTDRKFAAEVYFGDRLGAFSADSSRIRALTAVCADSLLAGADETLILPSGASETRASLLSIDHETRLHPAYDRFSIAALGEHERIAAVTAQAVGAATLISDRGTFARAGDRREVAPFFDVRFAAEVDGLILYSDGVMRAGMYLEDR